MGFFKYMNKKERTFRGYPLNNWRRWGEALCFYGFCIAGMLHILFGVSNVQMAGIYYIIAVGFLFMFISIFV